jgi:hypothetical protein
MRVGCWAGCYSAQEHTVDKSDSAIDPATSIVKSACTLWAGPFGGLSAGIIDLVSAKVVGKLQQRKTERFFQNCVDVIAERLIDLMDHTGKKLDDVELIPATYAVRDTFDRARVTLSSLMEADLDARFLERHMAPARREVLTGALLNESGIHYYDLILRESCAYAIELVSTLPSYNVAAFSELLKGDSAILDSLQSILARLPDRQSIDDFDADYRRLVIYRLDRMQLFGINLHSGYGRRYPLSVAYVSLGATSPGVEPEQPYLGVTDPTSGAATIFRSARTSASGGWWQSYDLSDLAEPEVADSPTPSSAHLAEPEAADSPTPSSAHLAEPEALTCYCGSTPSA